MSRRGSRVPGTVACVSLLLAACAGDPPITPDTGIAACPDLSGRYSANGRTQDGEGTSSLPLQFDLWMSGWREIEHVDIDGVRDGALRVRMYAGSEVVRELSWREPALRCGEGAVLLPLERSPIGGGLIAPLPIVAAGASGGWRLFRKAEDGRLLAEWHRKDTMLLLLVIPMSSTTRAYVEFDPLPAPP